MPQAFSPSTGSRILRITIFTFAFLLCASRVFAALANAWHIADSAEIDANAGSGTANYVHMRDPWIEISNNPASPTTVTIYQGLQKWTGNGATQIANQTGGMLYYKGQSQLVWTGTALGFHWNTGNNQYWKASFSTAGIAANDPIQYYIYLTTDGYNGVSNTYLYAPTGTGDVGGSTTSSQATAATFPFTVRNRPGWIFHANNRVINGNEVDFWAKVGYIGDANNVATKWATNGAVYYTTDGSTPSGSLGVGSGSTQVAAFSYDHPESNNQSTPSIAGTAMWWVASVPTLLQNVALGTTIKYKVGFWNSANNEEKFGDYNAGTANTVFSFTNGTVGDPVLTITDLTADSTLNGNYTTTKLFIDEVAGDSRPLQILFSPGQSNITAVECYTNLNRRDKAGQVTNGVEEGISPPDGNTIVAGGTNYFTTYAMTSTGSAGQYGVTLYATKTGAYRLTARWKVSGDPAWRWYTNSSAGRRDHAITVSPVDARNISLYEVNALNVEADNDDFAHRSTFEDLCDAPGAPHSGTGVTGNRWNLNYVKNLGCNWLWFQPVHPIGIVGQSLTPGSPYAVKNFFEIDPLMTKNFSGSPTSATDLTSTSNRAAAMTAFQNFVAAADAAGVGVMLDAPFNHTSPDCELAAKGVQLFSPNSPVSDAISAHEARFYSRDGNYAERASSASNLALAPDRGDFGKWGDVRDVYFGRYAALVDINPDDNGNYLNEGDWFDYSIGTENASGSGNGHFDSITQNVWKYFAEYPLFWLTQTGVPAGSDLATQTAHGLHGLRADFGQGLPPQLWEYIINKTRTRKWNFVFMAESLDGGAVTYRSNRHFDVLNENIVFPLKSASTASDFRNIFESRRSTYGQGLVLLNSMSHDEEAYADPFVALTRYAVCNTIDGAPLIFNGQELGISTNYDANNVPHNFGFHDYETNFGKQVAQFKTFNDMLDAWKKTTPGDPTYNYGIAQLSPVFAAIGQARQFSRALRSSNRYFLDQTGGGGTHPSIFSVAKFETKNASPNFADVVFAFANIDRNNNQTGNFNVAQDTDSDGVNDYGIKPARTYNVRNIAAYTGVDPNRRSVWQWVGGRTGSDILTNGVFVSINKVPTMDSSANPSDPAWNQRPYEAQYLKLYDVTPPPTAGAPSTPKPYSVLNSGSQGQTTFTWSAASDPDGGISGYHVTITTAPNGGGTVLFDGTTGATSQTFTGSYGQTLYASVKSINNAGIESSSASTSSAGTILLDPNGDADGDGMTNAAEDAAGTNLLDAKSVFKVTSVSIPAANNVQITWTSVADKNYVVESAANPGATFTPLSGTITATGTNTSYTDTGATGSSKFYRVRLAP